MNYIVKEFQTNGGVTAEVNHTMQDPSSYNGAVSEFLITSGYAAISNVEVHTVSILTEDGRLVMPSYCFRHPVVNQQEEIVEPEEITEPEGV